MNPNNSIGQYPFVVSLSNHECSFDIAIRLSQHADKSLDIRTNGCPRRSSSQQGFSLISAIFLLVVIAALGTFAVTLSTTQQQSDALDVLGARGYQAARAGIEWAAFNVTQSPANAPAAWSGCAQNTTPLGTLGGNLSAFTVTVNCAAASYVEAASTIWIYDISAVAVTGGSPGSPGYIERVISAKMGR